MPNIIYEKFKAVAIDGELTSERVADTTKAQAATMMNIGADYVDDKVFEVAKKAVLRQLERRKWQKVLSDLKAQLVGGNRVWLKNNFPAAEFEIDHRAKVVRIYLEGKIIVEEVE